MKLATLKNGTRDGSLLVVKKDLSAWASAAHIAPNLQTALDTWTDAEPKLRALASDLEAGRVKSEPYDVAKLLAPLPRAYEWVDGSAYLNHILLVRKARGAEPPPGLEQDPLVYQGGSGVLLGPRDPLSLPDPAWGLDFEAEIAVVLGDVPRGVAARDAARCIRLLMLVNDVTYRNLVPPELAKGFGFFVSKPATAFGPFAVTPDELGESFRDGRAFLRVQSTYNGTRVGDLESGPEMHFSFCDLLAHIAKTRAYTAGTVLGSGTVSNRDSSRGVSCLAELRTLETLARGAPETPFMKVGDTIHIEAIDPQGHSVFGAIEQAVIPG